MQLRRECDRTIIFADRVDRLDSLDAHRSPITAPLTTGPRDWRITSVRGYRQSGWPLNCGGRTSPARRASINFMSLTQVSYQSEAVEGGAGLVPLMMSRSLEIGLFSYPMRSTTFRDAGQR